MKNGLKRIRELLNTQQKDDDELDYKFLNNPIIYNSNLTLL